MSWTDDVMFQKIVSCGWAGGKPNEGNASSRDGIACAFIELENGTRLNVMPDDEEMHEVTIKVRNKNSRGVSRLLEEVTELGGSWEWVEP